MSRQVYGLIGQTLGHSISPRIHSAFADYDYQLFPLPPEQLSLFLARPDIAGLNVTMPYKQAVIPYCCALSPQAQAIGSVNTLCFGDDGSITGHNTDYAGFVWMLQRAGIDPADCKVLIFGSGGTSRTARAACADLGAGEIIAVSRKGPVTYQNLAQHKDADIIINTTPVGMYPNCPARLIDLAQFPNCQGVADVVYHPLRTQLVLDAMARGIPASGGLPMLVMQAKAAVELFCQKTVPEERAEQVLLTLQRQLENIVLIGMPGCGKSSVAKALSALLHRPVAECDTAVEQQAGMTIPHLFATQGEAAFRQMEQEQLRRMGAQWGQVISTGGGAVLSQDNYAPLKQNGTLYFLQRPLEHLATQDRPLSAGGTETLRRLYEQRLPLYRAFADAEIPCDTVAAAANIIAEDIGVSTEKDV